ncbi:MAG: 2-amino-4-hydroxy-6-hydroxymethyldihydropteridine diphosphokinase [Polyangiaceae bacterium]|nr:2-amino-4-hydroxy-6-hydroxymethyldihydropteridine diphosphokinase [Polyangiaceae bacterium]
MVGLGGNLGPRLELLRRAADALAATAGVALLGRSSVWESPPVGPPQPDYLNAAVLLGTALGPPQLLGRCLEVERALGRERRPGERWGPRTIDLDILWWSGGIVEAPELRVPHARLCERPFALRPLVELQPDAVDPHTGARYAELAAARSQLVRIAAL